VDPFTSPLGPSEIKLFCNYGFIKSFPKKCILITEGETSDNVYVILNGRVRVYVSDENGREVSLSIQRAGEFFGEVATIDGLPRSASVMTLEPTKLCVIPSAGFKRCLQENPVLPSKLLVFTLSRVRLLTENVKNMALFDVYGRVVATLNRLAIDQGGERVVERMTHETIAGMIGASREMVSRIIRGLVTGGYIKYKKRFIVIKKKLPNSW
jgi:CRP/FNR family cyclic AMP-dependent transcriptional regulator